MITVDGDKFVIARWIYDEHLKDFRNFTSSFDDESLVKAADIAVLRNQEDFNKLGNKIQAEVQAYYGASPGDYPSPIVWSWHIPDPQDRPIPSRMILFCGEEEVCTVWFEQIPTLD